MASKAVVLNGPEADLFLVTARTGNDVLDSAAGISLFAVPKNAPGLSCKNYKTYDGRSACELQLDNVALDAQALVGVAGEFSELAEPIFLKSHSGRLC